MQWKGPYVISGCKGKSNYCIEVDNKKKNFLINMLKHSTKRKKNEGISKNTEKELVVEPVKVGVGIRKTEKNTVLTMMNCWSRLVAIKRRTFGIYNLE